MTDWKNPESRKEYYRIYNKTNKEKVSLRKKNWLKKHPGYWRRWYEKNKDKALASNRKWELKNLDKVRAYKKIYQRQWYQKNKKEIYQKQLQWNYINPQKRKAYKLVKKAVKRGTLIKRPCEICDDTKNIYAHHWSYETLEDIYDVTWLCPIHHKEAHKLLSCERN